MSIDPKKFGLSDSLVNAVNEALKGDQHKIDANKNGKIDANDFKKLRGEQAAGEKEKQNYKHDMMKSEVADGNKANFKQNMKEEAEQIDEKVKTTHENPLVTVHDKDGLHTHANLSTANKIFNTKVKHTDVHAGPVKTKDGHETKNNLTFAISKHHASAMKEEAEQIDELSPATLSSYKAKAAGSETSLTNKSSTLSVPPKDRNAAAVKANQRRIGMKLATKKIGEEVELEEAHMSEKDAERLAQKHVNAAKSAKKAGDLKGHDAHAEASNDIRDMILKHTDSPKGIPSGKMQRTAEKLFSESVDEAATKLVAKPQYDKARPAFGGANAVADMDARKTEVQRKIAAKQASFQQAKANKRISGSPIKEAGKCTCGEGKGSKMTCEVCNSDKGLKGGKEPIIMNPPLKEASDLPKAVVTKGHEIAKSLIKHRSKVKEPYAVGMATAKKSAGIKD
jgi:hypothetical protein